MDAFGDDLGQSCSDRTGKEKHQTEKKDRDADRRVLAPLRPVLASCRKISPGSQAQDPSVFAVNKEVDHVLSYTGAVLTGKRGT